MGRTSHDELAAKLREAATQVEVSTKYCHYKNPGNHYLVEGLEIREETEEVSVRYRALYGAGFTWNRLLSEWLKPAEVDGKSVARFQKVV